MGKMFIPSDIESYIFAKLSAIVYDSNVPENHGEGMNAIPTVIEHNAHDGFLPFTNGGYDLILNTDLRTVRNSGSIASNPSVQSLITQFINDSLNMAVVDFINEFRIEAELDKFYTEEELDNPSTHINYHRLYEDGFKKLAEKLSEIEDDYLSDIFYYQFRVLFYKTDNYRNKTGQDEVLFIAGTNVDLNYGRDAGLYISYQNTIPVDKLTTEQVDDIITDMINSI